MLVKDTPVLQRHRYMKRVENTRATTVQGVQNDLNALKLVQDKHTSVANPEVQMGKRLTATEFMQKLHKINKDLVLEPHPAVSAPKNSAFHKLNYDKAVLYLVVGDQKIYVMVCEGDYMPEWDTMNTAKSKVPVDVNDPGGAWKEEQIPWHLVKRGWRTVLARLVMKRIVGLDAVEREFGAGARQSWVIMTGKKLGILPY
jgi:hypothetical protein